MADLQLKIYLDVVRRDFFVKRCYTVILGVRRKFTAAQEPHILFSSATTTLSKTIIPTVFATQEKILSAAGSNVFILSFTASKCA